MRSITWDPRNDRRFPAYVRVDFGVEHRFKIRKYRPWIGVRADNALSSFLPSDVQANISSPAFGTFYNSEYRQFRIQIRFETVRRTPPDLALTPQPPNRASRSSSLAALGVVYGDIGTSPLYALRECFSGSHAIAVTPKNVARRAVADFLVADHHGVDQVPAVRDARRQQRRGRHSGPGRAGAIAKGGKIVHPVLVADRPVRRGASLRRRHDHAGDLGAERGRRPGRRDAASSSRSSCRSPWSSWSACFWCSSRGTGGIGAVFGPIMIVWFVTLIASSALPHIIEQPAVLGGGQSAPRHRVPSSCRAWLARHAGRRVPVGDRRGSALRRHGPLRPQADSHRLVLAGAAGAGRSTTWARARCCCRIPTAREHPFFYLAPGWALLPLVVLSTMATVIASQAVISGAFSLTQQAIQLGYSPRFNILHTSAHEKGQVYIPEVNWLLMFATVGLVFGFQHVDESRRGLRHGRDDDDGDYDVAGFFCGTRALGLELVPCRTGDRGLPGRRPVVLRRERDQDSSTAAGSRCWSRPACMP